MRYHLTLPGLLLVAALSPAIAQSQSCSDEATRLRRAESELPKLEVAPPDDKQIVCITLETNILFAQKLKAHLKQCPRSPYAKSAGDWSRLETSYTSRFRSRDCKPTIRGYRG
jgi:hypothetical protein